jgi:Ca2+-binding RTX toxin-like protein
VNGAGVSFGGINIGSSAARFTAKDDPDGNDAVGDGGNPDHITSVAISFGGQTKAVALAAFGPVIVGGHSFTIDAQPDGSVIVDGLVSNASIATYTASGFNSLEVAYASGNAFIITGFGTASVLAAPVNFNVPVELVDADGDAAAATLGVTLLPPPVSDVVDGGAGADTMYGLAGDDAYFVDNFADTVFENAGEGTDTVYSTAHFRLSDNVENLILQGAADMQGYGNGLSNTLYGNSGNNLLDGGAGADGMFGGAGNDVYFVDNAGDAAIENADEGSDAVFSTAHFALSANVETLVLQGGADLQGYGNDLANKLYGNAGSNLLDGRAGADAMFGGAGNDVYFVDDAGDLVFENLNEGTDAVFATVNQTLSANVETLVLQGSGNLTGTGNALDNKLYGNTGDNTLDGGAGIDRLTGGTGNDTFVFSAGQADGDIIVDFDGQGAAAGDLLQFVGYGPGATFTTIDPTRWQVNYNGGASHEVITFMNGASIHASDIVFM